MKQLTLRGLPPEVEKKVAEEASRKGLSYNKAIISLLKKATDSVHDKGKAVYHDLDHLCGVWNEDEGAEFEEHLLEQRKIDENLWK
jgi:hypothetical protein